MYLNKETCIFPPFDILEPFIAPGPTLGTEEWLAGTTEGETGGGSSPTTTVVCLENQAPKGSSP